LVNDVLGWLLERLIFDQVLEAQTMLLVVSGFLNLLVNQLLPCDVLGVRYLMLGQEGWKGAKHTSTEGLCWMEAFRSNVDRHATQRINKLLLLVLWLRLLLHIDLRQVDGSSVLGHLSLVVLHRCGLLGLVLLWLLHAPLLFIDLSGLRGICWSLKRN